MFFLFFCVFLGVSKLNCIITILGWPKKNKERIRAVLATPMKFSIDPEK